MKKSASPRRPSKRAHARGVPARPATRAPDDAPLAPLRERPNEIFRLLTTLDAQSRDGGPRDALVVLADCRWEHSTTVAATLVVVKKGQWNGGEIAREHLSGAFAEVRNRVYIGWVPYKFASTVVIDLLLDSQRESPPSVTKMLLGMRAEIERLATLERGERVAALILDSSVCLRGFSRDTKSFILSPGGDG
jgi:hypothetical protein